MRMRSAHELLLSGQSQMCLQARLHHHHQGHLILTTRYLIIKVVRLLAYQTK